MPVSRLRRILIAAAPLLVSLALMPAPASAAASFTPCTDHRDFECATVQVPLDRTGRVGGTVPLHVERQRGTADRATAWIGLAGGPGQSAASLAEDNWLTLGAPVAGVDQILTFDQRGTGQSGLIDCSRALKGVNATTGVARCGAQLGDRRPFYSTTDSVEDIEAVREAVGAQNVVLVGVSYGTYVALRYARAHPDRTAALVLDSTVPLQGVDQWDGPTYAAIPGILQKLCAGGACPFTKDPVGDLRTVAARLQSGARAGTYVSASGRTTSQRIRGASLLYGLLLDGDLNPQLRAYLPGAIASARAGDWAPLVRLVRLDYGDTATAARGTGDAATEDQAQDSDGVFLATTCSDTVLPWAPISAIDGRGAALKSAAQALSAPAFLPFDRATVLETSTGYSCFPWPSTASQPYTDSGAPLPVPTLVLSGGADLRTPTSEAQLTQAMVPGSTLVTVAGVGHYVLGNDPSGCAVAAYSRFLTGIAIGDPCAGVDAAATTLPRAPLDLDDVPTLGAAGTAGRVARVAARTMVDGLASSRLMASVDPGARIGGLRGGWLSSSFTRTAQRVTLHGVQYLRGIRVSGTITSTAKSLTAKLKVQGGRASRSGTVRIVDDRLTGTIGGHRITSIGGKRRAHAARAAGGAGGVDPDLGGVALGAPGIDIG